MARPRDFDLDAALDAAVECFWRHGWAGTSVRTLCEAMDIRPGSFYAAFGSKEACFRRALSRYLETQPAPGHPEPAAIVRWLDVVVDPARMPKGCLLVHSAVERPSLDAESQALVVAAMARMEAFFTQCLAARPTAQRDGSMVASMVVALHVRARAGETPARLRAMADDLLTRLDIS